MKRKFICFLTTVMMIVVFIPTFAFAEGEIPSPNSPPENGEIAPPDGAGEPEEPAAPEPDPGNNSGSENPEPEKPDGGNTAPAGGQEEPGNVAPDPGNNGNSGKSGEPDNGLNLDWQYKLKVVHEYPGQDDIVAVNDSWSTRDITELALEAQTFKEKAKEGYECTGVECLQYTEVNGNANQESTSIKNTISSEDGYSISIDPSTNDFKTPAGHDLEKQLFVTITFSYAKMSAAGDTLYNYDAVVHYVKAEDEDIPVISSYYDDKEARMHDRDFHEKILAARSYKAKEATGWKCTGATCDRITYDSHGVPAYTPYENAEVKVIDGVYTVNVSPAVSDYTKGEDSGRSMDLRIQFLYEKTSTITLKCVDESGKDIIDPTSIEVTASDKSEINPPDLRIKGYEPIGYSSNKLNVKQVGEYKFEVQTDTDGTFTYKYGKNKKEELYLKVIIDDGNGKVEEKEPTLIYIGEANNGASLSTKYADKQTALETGLYDRLNDRYAETDVTAKVEDGKVIFNWIHHSNSNGHNPERMSREYQLTVDGKKIKASNLPITWQESSPDHFDIHIFTVTIDLSKLTDVIVHYVDEEGNEIAKEETLTGYEDDDFDPDTIDIKEIEGYEDPQVGEVPEKYPSDGAVDVYITYKQEQKYTVTYTDGVDGEEVFKDQVTSDLKKGTDTPAFEGNPEREGYVFTGWSPEVADKVTGDATYVAQWKPGKVNYTVEYYYQEKGKYPDKPSETATYKGTTGNVVALSYDDMTPQRPGYVLDKNNKDNIKDATVNADGSTVLRVYFEEEFNIVIHYINKDTGEEFETYEAKAKYGDELDKTSPQPQTGYKFEDPIESRIQETITKNFETTIYYIPKEFKTIIHYVADEDTTIKLRDDYEIDYTYEETKDTVYNTDTFEGRELVNRDDVSITYSKTDNHKYTIRYKLIEVDATIHYVDIDTKEEIAKTYEKTFTYGETLEKVSPTLEGYELINPKTDEIVTHEMKETYDYTVYYKLKEYPVTVNYVDEDGNPLLEAYEDIVKHGKSTGEIESPEIEGYELVNPDDDKVIENPKVTEAYTYDVVYQKKSYPVIIHYVDESGNPIADDYTDTLKYKESLEKESPAISGYLLADSNDAIVRVEEINGKFEYTVIYKKIIEPTPDPIIDPDDPQIMNTIINNSKAVCENNDNEINSDSPKTDDPTNILLMLFAMTIAAIAAITALIRKKH